MRLKILVLSIVAAILSGCSGRQVSVTSPDGRLRLNLSLDSGQSVISVDYKGARLVDDSPVGFEFDNGLFGQDLSLKSGKVEAIVEDYDLYVGKASHVHSVSNQRVVTLKDASGHTVEMYLRAFDDGVAFRYVIHGDGQVRIKKEILDVTPTGNPMLKAMYLACAFGGAHEDPYITKPLKDHSDTRHADMPALFSYPDGTQLAITEAMVVDYAAMVLGVENGVVSGILAPRIDEPEFAVIAEGQVRTPWRVFMVSDRPGALLESNILTSLCDPCEETDLAWLEPGKSTWPWWNGYQAPASAYKGDINTINTNINKYYIDFCAENGILYHSVTGLMTPDGKEIPWYYNEYSSTSGPKDTDDAKRVFPGFDFESISEYARSKGVKLRVHIHRAVLSKDIEGTFRKFKELGISGMMVDFLDRDDQEIMTFQRQVLELAMKYQLHIQFHGSNKPTGLQRTYPCEFTREGTLNYEGFKADFKRLQGAEHVLNMPFTRCLAGSTDFHLGGFRAVPYDDYKPDWWRPEVTSTRCHMLALYVVLESALQLVSDSPEAYEGQPGFEFIQEVPTVWDETRVLQAEIDEYIVVARRSGEDWYVGAIGNQSPRVINLALDFLGKEAFSMDLFKDAGDCDTNPNHLLKTVKSVSSSDTIEIPISSRGGFAVHFSPIE